jgi:hypothetical protein
MQGQMQSRGALVVRKIKRRGPGLGWHLRNRLRWGFLKGWIAKHAIAPFANWWGVMTAIAELEITLIKRNGERVYYGVVGYRVITNNGVGFLVDAWQNLTELETMIYHGCGTGTTAEAAADSALVTESTTALNPDSTRATGTQSEPGSNQLRSTGTATFDGSAAITEHGLFSQAATGGGTLFDRTVFSAVNVVSGESIQFQYTVTFTAGG